MEKYQVIVAYSADSLAAEVEGMQASGWICQGGVSFANSSASSGMKFAQALVKPRPLNIKINVSEAKDG